MAIAPVYATLAQFTTWNGTAGDMSNQLLRAASRIVDELLFGAVYDIDHTTQVATDEHVRDAIRDATCAQAAFMDDAGDTTGNGVETVDSASIGSVSYSGKRTTSAGSSTSGASVSQAAVRELKAAGLRTVVFVHG